MKDLIKIGKIVNTQGLRGEMRVYSYADYKERFEEFDSIFMEKNDEEFFIEKVRYKKNLVIIKFKNYDHINDVEKFKGKTIFIKKEKRDLDEDTHFVSDIIGTSVYLENNQKIGQIKDVLETGANDVYVIEDKENDKEYMIPVVKQFVKIIDLENDKIVITPIEGML